MSTAVSVDPSPAPPPSKETVLEGVNVHLQHIKPADADELFDALENDDSLWDYLYTGPWPDRAEFAAKYVNRVSGSDDPIYYAVRERRSGPVVGQAALLRFDTANRVVEIGGLLFSPRLKRTRAATECIFLLARHVVEDLGYRRVEWKCNALNEPSARAAVRYGFTYEGLFRQLLIVKGKNRDSKWFSLLDGEWPAVKAGFLAWLADDNFDTEGRQRRTLVECREQAQAQTRQESVK